METLLMDPMSALIGGGLSLIGGLMNTSSQQSINAANLQQQIWSAEGGYLPGLRANAEKAGFNPLAVLGSRGPNMAVQVGTQPGSGLQQAGNIVSKMDIEGHELDLQAKREEVAQRAALTLQTNVERAKNQWLLEQWQSGKLVPPGSEPAADTTIPGAVLKGAKDVVSGVSSAVDRGVRQFKDYVPSDAWRSFLIPPAARYGKSIYDYTMGR